MEKLLDHEIKGRPLLVLPIIAVLSNDEATAICCVLQIKFIGMIHKFFRFSSNGHKTRQQTDTYVRFFLLKTKSVALQKCVFHNTNKK